MLSQFHFCVSILFLLFCHSDEDSSSRIDSASARVALIQSIDSGQFGKLIKVSAYNWILKEIESKESKQKLKESIPVPTESGLIRIGDWYYNPVTSVINKNVKFQSKSIHINVILQIEGKKVTAAKILFLPDGDK